MLACLKGMHQRRNVLTNDPFPKNTTTYDDVVYLYTLSLFGKKHEDNGTECGRLLEMVEEQMVDGERRECLRCLCSCCCCCLFFTLLLFGLLTLLYGFFTLFWLLFQ